MKEGWFKDNYFILFDGDEIQDKTKEYSISEFIPGYELIGLIGWDDFLIKNTSGEIFRVPTIPLLARYIEPLNCQQLTLEADDNYKGKIKWYIKPLVFGGDPGADNNLAWLTHEDHVKAVKWWNKKYIESVKDITEQNA